MEKLCRNTHTHTHTHTLIWGHGLPHPFTLALPPSTSHRPFVVDCWSQLLQIGAHFSKKGITHILFIYLLFQTVYFTMLDLPVCHTFHASEHLCQCTDCLFIVSGIDLAVVCKCMYGRGRLLKLNFPFG